MAKKVLNIVEAAYRATLEEQDDTVLWLTQVLHGAGADVTVLLRGNAVNYAVRGQDASGLALGEWRQMQPPRLEQDLERLLGKGVRVLAVADDLAERGLEPRDLASGVETVARSGLPSVLEHYDQVWHW